MGRPLGPARASCCLWLALGLAVACSAGAPAGGTTAYQAVAPRETASAAYSAPPGPASGAAPAGATPSYGVAGAALTTAPPVQLKVGVLPIAPWAPIYIGQERGYFQEVGLALELVTAASVNELLPSVAQGQIQVSACANNLGCFNALNRRTDLQIVADLQSAGKTEKSIGSNAFVVRKDLWDNGVIRGPQDLPGRTVHVIAGEASAPHLMAVRWLRQHGVDPHSVEWVPMGFPDVYAAMQNRASEVAYQTEPLLSAGLANGVHQLLVTQEEINPAIQVLYLLYWTGIERLGPQVGERFLVAYLRGARDYINAFEYGIDQDAIIDILTQYTAIKDPAVYRRIKYTYIDPNGRVSRTALEEDAELLRQLGLTATPLDLSAAFEDKYRQFAVQYLGEYQPPGR